jgi:branched-chain amino acid transport system substrate-binding protein
MRQRFWFRRANRLQAPVPRVPLFLATGLALALTLCLAGPARAEDGITRDSITVGSVLALKGQSQALGLLMKYGMEAAFRDQKVQGRNVVLVTANDYYDPAQAVIETKKLIDRGIFVMIGNVGTPTAAVTLPMLKAAGIPAVGFFTGAGLLRPGAGGPIVNYRASYLQEVAAVVNEALDAGVAIDQICAYVQNDAYGMAGLAGVKQAYENRRGSQDTIRALDTLLKMDGDNPQRNYLGPVGVYARADFSAAAGYKSLKQWERDSGQRCRVVVTVGTYAPVAEFVRLSRKSGERWVITAVSFTGADALLDYLKQYNTMERVVMTQVVPLLDSNRSIVLEGKQWLDNGFSFVSLEGYIVGKMFLTILRDIKGDITRESFMKQVAQSKFDLGGISIDFTHGNQGSNFVASSFPTGTGFHAVTPALWRDMLK